VQDVTELLGDLEVAEHATVLVAQSIGTTGLPRLVTKAWDLSGLAGRYDAFWAEFSRYLARTERTQLKDHDAFLVRTRLVHHFRGFPRLDPELPEELAPLGKSRERAVRAFQQLFEAFAGPAESHFHAVATGPAIGRVRGSVTDSKVMARK
jgi:phenylacetic acid degradation operon negative regulatory protein